jgi:hypothetical protein
MDSVTADLDPAFACLDDILVASKSEEHKQAVKLVLERLRDNGLVLNIEKYEYGMSELEFIGHRVSAAGVEPLSSHVEAIRDFQPPVNKQGLQRFLGLVNFYHWFLLGAAGVLKPLTDVPQGPGGKKIS